MRWPRGLRLLCTMLGVAEPLACGSSTSKSAPRSDETVERDAGLGDARPIDDAAAVVPVRTMRRAELLGGTSINNLLIDPTFDGGEPGIGRWLSSFSLAGC